MRRKLLIALALTAIMGLGGFVLESAAAGQNTNSSTTMSPQNTNMASSTRRRGRRGRRKHRRGRRMSKTTNKNSNM